jgi:hypothetical protein
MRVWRSRSGERAGRSSAIDARSSSPRPESRRRSLPQPQPARGERWGEQGPARGVPPPEHPFGACQVDAVPASRADASRQLQSSLGLANCGLRAALFAARTNSIPPTRRSMVVPWRERPRDLAGSAITPAATAEVARATLSLSQSEQAISSMRPAQSAKARAICTGLHRPSDSIVRFAVARSRRAALLRPRMRG